MGEELTYFSTVESDTYVGTADTYVRTADTYARRLFAELRSHGGRFWSKRHALL